MAVVQQIESELAADAQKQRRIHQLLVIGLPLTGKSTIVQTLGKIRWGDSYLATISESWKHHIQKSCYSNGLRLCSLMNDDKKYKQLSKLSIDNEQHLIKIADIINDIWMQDDSKNMYAQSCIYDKNKLDDNMDKFFNKIQEIISVEYEPTTQDAIYYHHQCNHIQTLQYEVSDYGSITAPELQLIDVPSNFNHQLSKKSYLFEPLFLGSQKNKIDHAMVYVTDLTKYCQIAPNGYNALEQDLEFFSNVVGDKFFRKCEIILLMNKDDLLRERLLMGMPFVPFLNTEYQQKLQEHTLLTQLGTECVLIQQAVDGFMKNIDRSRIIPSEIIELIRRYLKYRTKQFPDSEEDVRLFNETYECMIKFIHDLFILQNKDPNRRIFSHVITAVDADNVQVRFWDIRNILIRSVMSL